VRRRKFFGHDHVARGEGRRNEDLVHDLHQQELPRRLAHAGQDAEDDQAED